MGTRCLVVCGCYEIRDVVDWRHADAGVGIGMPALVSEKINDFSENND